MATPSTRTPVRIARGSYSNLNSSLSDLQDGEIMYAEDQDKLYVKDGSSLVVLTQPAANPIFTGNVTVNAQGDLRLADSDSSNYVGFQSPATVSANVVWTLPAADGSANQLLKTNGSGVLSWGTVDLSTYAPLASPTLTGTPAAPTASANTSTTQIATTAFVMTELGDYAPLAAPAFTGTATGVNLTLSGNLTVNGTTTTIDTTNLEVTDKNIIIGKVSTPSDATADGGGWTLKGATDKTFNWVDSTDAWTSSEHIDLASGKVLKVAGSQVLSAAQYTGNAATATALATARTIGGTSFDGSANIAVALAGTATALATARTIGGVSFDGTANINLPGVNASGNQDTSGNAATATTATNVTVADESSDTTCFPLFATAATGNLAPKSGTNLTFNSDLGTLTASYFAGSGYYLTSLNASSIGSGTVSTARLGSGSATSSTFLRGDGTWANAGVNSDDQFNTAAGTEAANSLSGTDPSQNSFFGYRAGYNQTTADNNTLLGFQAGYSSTTEQRNTFIGANASQNNTTGQYCVGIGFAVFRNGDHGDANIAIGDEAAKTLGSSSSYNIAIGQSSGYVKNNSNHNTAIGKNALGNASGGVEYNIAIGGYAIQGNGNFTGDKNIGIGAWTLQNLTTSSGNIVLGNESAKQLTSGSGNNISIGNYALGYDGNAFTGNNCIVIGEYAGRKLEGNNDANTFIGGTAGDSVTTGNNNTCIGYGADATSATTQNEITLGNGSVTKFRVPGVSLEVTSSGVSDAKGNLRSVPTRNETSAYTLVAADAGKCINADNGVTVPNGVFAAGDVITIINMATSNKTITQGSGLTMRNVGDDGSTGNVSVKQYAMCTLIFTASSVCFFSTTAKA